MKHPRIWAGADGASHFDEIELEETIFEYVPGHPTEITAPSAAVRVHFTRWPGGHFMDWHPSPHRHYVVTMSGEFEVRVSDGETRRFRAGDVYLGEDTSGQGHQSRSLGDQDWVAAIVTLTD